MNPTPAAATWPLAGGGCGSTSGQGPAPGPRWSCAAASEPASMLQALATPIPASTSPGSDARRRSVVPSARVPAAGLDARRAGLRQRSICSASPGAAPSPNNCAFHPLLLAGFLHHRVLSGRGPLPRIVRIWLTAHSVGDYAAAMAGSWHGDGSRARTDDVRRHCSRTPGSPSWAPVTSTNSRPRPAGAAWPFLPLFGNPSSPWAVTMTRFARCQRPPAGQVHPQRHPARLRRRPSGTILAATIFVGAADHPIPDPPTTLTAAGQTPPPPPVSLTARGAGRPGRHGDRHGKPTGHGGPSLGRPSRRPTPSHRVDAVVGRMIFPTTCRTAARRRPASCPTAGTPRRADG